jgi:hypothetical protein
MFEGPWTITTAYVSIAILVGTVAILGITIYESFIAPGLARRKRFRDLTHPAEVYFLIQSKNMNRPIDSEIRPIAIRDDRVHKLKEIVLQSNSEYLLEILVEPITNFRTWATIFGCDEMKTAQKSRTRAGQQVETCFSDAVGRLQTQSQRAFLDDVAQSVGNHFLATDRYQKCT